MPEVVATHDVVLEQLWFSTEHVDHVTLQRLVAIKEVCLTLFGDMLVCSFEYTSRHKVGYRYLMLIATNVHADVLAETSQCAFGDTYSHLGTANYKDVVLQHILPYFEVVSCLVIILLRIQALSTLTGKMHTAIVWLLGSLKERVSHIERVETRLGVDFKNAGIVITENILGHLVGEMRLVVIIYGDTYRSCCIDILAILVLLSIRRNKILIPEAPATHSIAHVHVDHTPWGKHSLLVRIVEVREDGSNLGNTVLGIEIVSLLHHLTDALGSTREDVTVKTVFQRVERLLGKAFRHKLLP